MECAEFSAKNKLAQRDASYQNCLRTCLYKLPGPIGAESALYITGKDLK